MTRADAWRQEEAREGRRCSRGRGEGQGWLGGCRIERVVVGVTASNGINIQIKAKRMLEEEIQSTKSIIKTDAYQMSIGEIVSM